QNRSQGLAVSRWRDLSLVSEEGEEGLDFPRTHLPRMPEAVESNEEPHPIDVGLLGAQAVVGVADTLAQLIEQSYGLDRRMRHGMHVPVIPVHPNSTTLRFPYATGRLWRVRPECYQSMAMLFGSDGLAKTS